MVVAADIPLPSRAEVAALVTLTIAGAVLRLAGLDGQSYWFDEAVTVQVVGGSLERVLDLLPESESTPPLYYLAAWLWSQAFGVGELGLRSLSAVVGTLTIVVGWAVGRYASPRAGLFAAALIAANPMLIWYSQEARAYELVALLGAASILMTLRFAARPGWRRAAAWAVVGAAALLTHYFAVFLLAAEIAFLFWRLPDARRLVIGAAALPFVTGLALIPLARSQEADGRTEWISATPLVDRGWEVIRELVTANTSPVVVTRPTPSSIAWLLALPAVAIGIYGLARARERMSPLVLGVPLVAGAALVIPFLMGVTPLDFFYDRNLIAAWPGVLVALAIGIAAVPRLGSAAVALLVAAGVVASIQIATDDERQRDDWRGAAERLGPSDRPRALVVRPDYAVAALRVYGRGANPVKPGTGVKEIVIVGEPPGRPPAPQLGEFRLAGTTRIQRMAVIRYAAPRLVRLDEQAIRLGGSGLYYEPSERATRWFAAAIPAAAILRGMLANPRNGSVRRDFKRLLADRGNLPAVPPEIPEARRVGTAFATALDAAETLLHAPTEAARVRLEAALRRLAV